tara:strand:+ start:302 stop:736 length:435 start_codon:yes stop_codon:yes gene_type:complete
MKLDVLTRIIRLLVLVSLSVLGYGNSLDLFAAEIKSFEDFRGYCNKESIPDKVGQEALPDKLKEGLGKAVCESYIKGYLAVANHNCRFDIYADSLHKLNTKNISINQIIKAFELYDQTLIDNSNKTIIDHLWLALNPHWPCQAK